MSLNLEVNKFKNMQIMKARAYLVVGHIDVSVSCVTTEIQFGLSSSREYRGAERETAFSGRCQPFPGAILDEGDGPCLSRLLEFRVNVNVYIFSQGKLGIKYLL